KSAQRLASIGMNDSRRRPPASLYVAGPLSMGYVDFYTFLIPLYGLSLGLDASEIGILVGARSILTLFLSIHIGVLMDRFGTRRVTLFFVWTGMALAPLFPLVQGFWALLALSWLTARPVPSPGRVRRPWSPSLPRGTPGISASSASSPGSARRQRRYWPAVSGIMAELGRPICSAPLGARC